MSDGIYAVVKRYATSEGTPEKHYEDDGFQEWCLRPNDYDKIYDKMMEVTDGDHEISSDAASWCELATEGEIYEFREGEIEIMDIQ